MSHSLVPAPRILSFFPSKIHWKTITDGTRAFCHARRRPWRPRPLRRALPYATSSPPYPSLFPPSRRDDQQNGEHARLACFLVLRFPLSESKGQQCGDRKRKCVFVCVCVCVRVRVCVCARAHVLLALARQHRPSPGTLTNPEPACDFLLMLIAQCTHKCVQGTVRGAHLHERKERATTQLSLSLAAHARWISPLVGHG
jgi:hypothetical protein